MLLSMLCRFMPYRWLERLQWPCWWKFVLFCGIFDAIGLGMNQAVFSNVLVLKNSNITDVMWWSSSFADFLIQRPKKKGFFCMSNLWKLAKFSVQLWCQLWHYSCINPIPNISDSNPVQSAVALSVNQEINKQVNMYNIVSKRLWKIK